MRLRSLILPTLVVLSLSACMGSTSKDNTSTGAPLIPPSIPAEPIIPPSTQDRIDKALVTGNPDELKFDDEQDLLQLAIYEAGRLQNQQVTALHNIFNTKVSLSLDFSNNSISISPRQATVAFPYLVADNGNVLASASMQEEGRGLAYGRDILELIDGNGAQAEHKPLLNRAVNWLVNNDANQDISTLNYAIYGYDNNRFSSYLSSRDIEFKKADCDLNNVNNNCWQDADLLVFGYNTAASPEREAQIKRYQQAGANILYIHAS